MPDPITLFTIPGNECIGDSLPKINSNYFAISGHLNTLFTNVDELSAAYAPTENLQSEIQEFKTSVWNLSSYWRQAWVTSQEIEDSFINGSIFPDLVKKPFSTSLSSIAITLSSISTGLTNNIPDNAVSNQILTYDISTFTWVPSAFDKIAAPYGKKTLEWNTTTETTTKNTSAGYISLPGGFIMQWGRLSAMAASHVPGSISARERFVLFPIPFPNAVLNITTSAILTGTLGGFSSSSFVKHDFTKNGFTLVKGLSGMGNVFETWTAIGF